MRTLAEQATRHWQRYVDSIPTAVTRFRYSDPRPSDEAVRKYEVGLKRYARILEREAIALTKGERKH